MYARRSLLCWILIELVAISFVDASAWAESASKDTSVLERIFGGPQVWVGGLVIVFYGLIRFYALAVPGEETDLTLPARAYTTLFFFFFAAFAYVAVLLVAYVLLIDFAALLESDKQLTKFLEKVGLPKINNDESVSYPIWAATILSIALPSVPILNAADKKLRAGLQQWAHIPRMARSLEELMEGSKFKINKKNESFRLAGERCFDNSVDLTEAVLDIGSPAHRYLKLAYLQEKLDRWSEQSAAFSTFLQQHTGAHKAICDSITKMRSDIAHLSGEHTETERNFIKEKIAGIEKRLYRFISYSLLTVEKSESACKDRLQWLGFRFEHRYGTFDVDMPLLAFLVTILVTLPAVFLCWSFVGDPTNYGEKLGEIMVFSACIALAHSLAIANAVLFRYRFLGERSQFSTERSVPLAWLLEAFLGYLSGAFVIALVALFYRYADWYLSGVIWGIPMGAAAVSFAWLCGIRPGDRDLRYSDALTQGFVTGGAASVAAWLAGGVVQTQGATGTGLETPELAFISGVAGGLIGAIIGFILPSRYRLKHTPRRFRARRTVAVIGAGMAGLACAKKLGESFFDVTVYEKNPDLGGRVFTGEINDRQFDQGTQYFLIRYKEFQTQLTEWLAEGRARLWDVAYGCLKKGFVERVEIPSPVYVGTPSMKELTRHLADRSVVLPGEQVAQPVKQGDKWRLHNTRGHFLGDFDYVIVSVPAPDAIPLLGCSLVLKERIGSVEMSPRWVLFLGFDASLALGYDVLEFADLDIELSVCDSRKPQRNLTTGEENWVIHATETWSRTHFDDEADEVEKHLTQVFLDAVSQVPGYAKQKLELARAQRWDHARVVKSVGEHCLFDCDAGIGACGDWCLGGHLSAAWMSGTSMANRLIDHDSSSLQAKTAKEAI